MALRTLGIAYKDIEYTTNYASLNENFLESDLTLIGIVGIKVYNHFIIFQHFYCLNKSFN